MEVQKKEMVIEGVKFFIEEQGREIARAYLYLLKNDLHKEPFGFIEDVFVNEFYRKKGYGTEILKAIIEEAKQKGCYKLICTSRYSRKKVHEIYQKLGFEDYGKEFRLDL